MLDSSCRPSACPLRCFADEVGRIIRAADSLVGSDLRIRTKRAGPIHSSVREMGREDLLRRGATRYPLLDGRHLVECVGAGTTSAVVHSGYHVQLDGLADYARTEFSDHIVEIVDAVHRCNLR